MSLRSLIFIIVACLILIMIMQGIGVAFGYFSDSESSVDNILRFGTGF